MKEFSEGFLHDIADLLEMCVENGTDNLEVQIPINGQQLNIEICFSIDEEKDGVDHDR